MQLAEGAELYFCAHHGREHGDKLRALAVDWYDETDKLVKTSAGTADSGS